MKSPLATYTSLYRGQRRLLLFSSLIALFVATLSFPMCWLIGNAFDQQIPSGDLAALALTGGLVLLLRSITAVGGVWMRSINLRATLQATCSLRRKLLHQLFTLPRQSQLSLEGGAAQDLVVTQCERVDLMSSSLVGLTLPAVLTCLVQAAVLAYLNWRLLAILLFLWPLIWCVNEVVRRFLESRVQTYNLVYRQLTHRITTLTRLLDLLRIRHDEQREIQRTDRLFAALADAGAPVALLSTAYVQSQQVLLTLMSVVVLLLGGREVSLQRMTMGEFLAFYTVVSLLNQALRDAAAGAYHILVGWQSMRRIHEWFREAAAIPPVYSGTRRLALRNELCLENVTFGYSEDRPLLRNTGLCWRAGETLVVTGWNGAGKSTLLWLLLGVYKPLEGRVLADGVAYADVDVAHLRAQVGVVAQEPVLFGGSIRDNLLFGNADATDQQLREALRLACAERWVNELPRGWDTPVGECGELLSGGQRQKLSIARTLIANPRFLVLDEPTNHLDADTIEALTDNLRGLQPRPALLLISHHPAVERCADRVVTLRDGLLTATASDKVAI